MSGIGFVQWFETVEFLFLFQTAHYFVGIVLAAVIGNGKHGLAALLPVYFLDDGMYLVTVLIVRAMKMKHIGSTLGSLISDLKEPVESTEIRLNITDQDFKAKGQEAIGKVIARAEADESWHIAPDNREGIRISFDIDGTKDAGWFLLRLSVHDPVLPVNAESDVEGGVKKMLQGLYEVLSGVSGVDLKNLENALA